MRGWLVVVAVLGCSKAKSEGLPPATEWSSNNVAPGVQLEQPEDTDPHAGLDMSGGGGPDDDRPTDVDPNGPNPHAGVDMTGGGDMSKLGLPPPDPNRPIDPSHRVAGVVRVAPNLADKVAGAKPVFLSVRRPDAAGNPTGMPIAVQKLVWTPGKDSIGFELTDRDAMVGIADSLSGDVLVIAHYDVDGEPTTRTSGDVLGTARVKVPADHVTITLDTPVP